jgi:hypothetical protein
MKHQHNAGCQQWLGQSEKKRQLAGIDAIAYVRYWLRRYLPAELVALAVAVGSVTLAAMLTSNELILVAAGVYSGSASYYGVLVAHMYITNRRAHPTVDGHSARQALIGRVRGLMLDFGSAELLDSLLFSPLLLYLCLRALPNHQLAVVLSEFVSTIVFYTTVIVARMARTSLAHQRRA